MATNPSTLPENAGRLTAPDANYPYGSAKNDSTGTTGDGTPIRKPWMDDIYGFFQALLKRANITPSGTPDNANVSQLADAVATIGGGKRNMVVITATGLTNWVPTIPMQQGHVKPKVTLIAGGGGASRISATATGAGGGGGGAAVGIVDLTGVSSVAVIIGAGGIGKDGSSFGDGTAGGNSSFGTTLLTATGGSPGLTTGVRSNGGVGGGTAAILALSGQQGGASQGGGQGGNSPFFSGGQTGGTTATAPGFTGANGVGPGGGGGGGNPASTGGAGAGGNGANGICIIEW